MPRRLAVLPDIDPNTIDALLDSFVLSMRASAKSPRTVILHVGGVRRFIDWLQANGRPTGASLITPDHLRAFMVARTDAGLSGNSVSADFRAVTAFFRWATAEGIVTTDPTDKVRQPRVEQKVVAVLSDDELRRLFTACAGTTFADRRDLALLRLLADTGLCRAELVGLRVQDIDTKQRVAHIVRGKGGRGRIVAYGDKTAVSLDRYLRQRRAHRAADLDALWLGRSHALTYATLRDAVSKRAAKAGVAMHLHQLRHTWASRMLGAGATEGDLMQLGGWRSSRMLQQVYAVATAADRAIAHAHKLALGDRL